MYIQVKSNKKQSVNKIPGSEEGESSGKYQYINKPPPLFKYLKLRFRQQWVGRGESSIKQSIKNKNSNYESTSACATSWYLMLVQCNNIIENSVVAK